MLWLVLGIVLAVGITAWIVYKLVNDPLFNDNDLFDDLFAEENP